MAAAAILKIAFWPLLINRLSDLSEILYEEAQWHVDKGYGTKKCKFLKFEMVTAAILIIAFLAITH